MAKRTKCFPPKCRNKAKILTFTTSIQHYTGDSSQCSKERRKKRKERKKGKGGREKKERKESPWRERSSIFFICRWHDSVCGKS